MDFNGVHAQLTMAQGNEILEDIKAYLSSCNHIPKATNENEINDLYDLVK